MIPEVYFNLALVIDEPFSAVLGLFVLFDDTAGSQFDAEILFLSIMFPVPVAIDILRNAGLLSLANCWLL